MVLSSVECLHWYIKPNIVGIGKGRQHYARAAVASLCMRSCFTNGRKRWFSSILDAPSPNIFSIESLVWLNIYPGTLYFSSFRTFFVVKLAI